MNKQVVYLRPEKPRPAATATSTAPPLIPGKRYKFRQSSPNDKPHGICSGFVYSLEGSRIVAPQTWNIDNDGYLWDADGLPQLSDVCLVLTDEHCIALNQTQLVNNKFTLSNTGLGELALECHQNNGQISLEVNFDFVYQAEYFPACLGTVNLVKPNCFAILENGEKHHLQNTDAEQSRLHVHNSSHTSSHPVEPIATILETDISTTSVSARHTEKATHSIPDVINGLGVESMTIMEQYTTFFMQRKMPFSTENIWIPVYTPISWGWSIRISRRHDGEWCISRKKLLMPITDQNGLEMPVWIGNTLNLPDQPLAAN